MARTTNGIVPGISLARFPLLGDRFVFGVSSSAYQIEGATACDGRGEGIWDTFCKEPGRISTGETASMACDHYHRMPADIRLISDAGIPNYRFSVSWPRLFPSGGAEANAKGFEFYHRLLDDELHRRRISPWLCLYHWDLPQALQAKGGWTNRDTAFRFAEFCAQVGNRFGDRVSHWMVMNEIATQSMLGYGVGAHAPGERGADSWLSALHHLSLGQGLGIQALRAADVKGRIGTIACCEPIRPVSDSEEDRAAARLFDGLWNGAVLEPLFNGRYPDIVAGYFKPFCKTDDLRTINQNIDLLGVN
jgi:beta-glucosidase